MERQLAKVIEICGWLKVNLCDGPKGARAIRRDASKAGYTRGELRAAKFLCCRCVECPQDSKCDGDDEVYWVYAEK